MSFETLVWETATIEHPRDTRQQAGNAAHFEDKARCRVPQVVARTAVPFPTNAEVRLPGDR